MGRSRKTVLGHNFGFVFGNELGQLFRRSLLQAYVIGLVISLRNAFGMEHLSGRTTLLEMDLGSTSRVKLEKDLEEIRLVIFLGHLCTQTLSWEGLLEHSLGELSWKSLLEDVLEKISWNSLLENSFGELTWTTLLGTFLAELFRKLLLGDSLANLSWKTLLDSSLGNISWDIILHNSLAKRCRGILVGKILESFLGRTPLGNSLGKLHWKLSWKPACETS